ncbi:MAG: hypothetical protein M1839_003181 [Geoglossum umbratile]|nr:MAG: hypothetical protein M1839_003181 [Geoglossum umbratile]
MAVESLKRPSLGQVATLGMLYDARSDRFLPHSVLRGTLSGEAVHRLDVNQAYRAVTMNETYKDKFNQMSVSSELGASFLAGFVNVEGSGRYLLTPERDTALTVHRALHYTISTLQENLNFSSSDFKDLLTVDELPSNAFATHLVTEITWGARCIVAATRTLLREDDRPEIEKALKSAFEKFESTEEWGFDAASTYPSQESDEITVYSDVLEHDELSTDLDGALTHVKNLPRLVTETSDSRGKPLAYTLFPINFFAMFFGVKIPATVSPGHVSAECQEKFVGLLDELRVARNLISDYYQRLSDYRICVRPSDICHVADRIRSARKAESSLRSSYTRSLKDIRTGRASSQNVWELVETFLRGDSAPRTLTAITNEYSERLSFVNLVEGKGANYVGYDGPSR